MESRSHYSATMPASPFALSETRTIARLLTDESERQTIRKIIHDGNLLKVKSDSNEKNLFNYIYNRLESFPEELRDVIINGSPSDSRYVNFISIMAYDHLFQDFVIEVYNQCLLNNDDLTDYAIMLFFENVAQYDERVAGWGYDTVYKLRRLYTRILFEAGLLDRSFGIRKVSVPFISKQVLNLLRKNGFSEFIEMTVRL